MENARMYDKSQALPAQLLQCEQITPSTQVEVKVRPQAADQFRLQREFQTSVRSVMKPCLKNQGLSVYLGRKVLAYRA